MRSPCTSLYGNSRPTTGTESMQSSRRTKLGRATKRMMQPATVTEGLETAGENAGRRRAGRPASQNKSAVKPDMLPDFVARAAAVLEANGGSMDSNLFGQHWKHANPNNPIYAFKSNKGVTIHQMLRENSRFFRVSDTTRQKVKFFELIPEEVTTFLGEVAEEQERQAEKAESSSLVAGMAEAVRNAVEDIDAPLPHEHGLDEAQSTPLATSLDAQGAAVDAVEWQEPAARAQEQDEVIHHHVPMQGKARHSTASGFDRRLKPKVTIPKESRVFDAYREELPQEPTADERDAIANPVVALYNSWAMDGRDVVMEVTHAAAFEELWEYVAEEKLHPKRPFTAIDGGCGNGWAARKMAEHPLCKHVTGVDAAAVMVDRAETLSADIDKVSYNVGDVAEWVPAEEVDVVNLCETLYLLDEPQAALDHIVPSWLKPGGLLVANLDCYWENKLSHAWEVDLGVPMQCMSENKWQEMFERAGLVNVKRWRSKSNGPWQGCLIITGERKAD